MRSNNVAISALLVIVLCAAAGCGDHHKSLDSASDVDEAAEIVFSRLDGHQREHSAVNFYEDSYSQILRGTGADIDIIPAQCEHRFRKANEITGDSQAKVITFYGDENSRYSISVDVGTSAIKNIRNEFSGDCQEINLKRSKNGKELGLFTYSIVSNSANCEAMSDEE